ncbi:hypothetical protein [Prochlorococcus sp. MIT 1341]|uniref:hypothetical protein n=1 Tax=Prochlorococcus sp. MIT 1341 TaxID=3096221 RepID=UPI002A74DF59|nr:hypothetical protein [Prochlorococcus sp. MIT 1341]
MLNKNKLHELSKSWLNSSSYFLQKVTAKLSTLKQKNNFLNNIFFLIIASGLLLGASSSAFLQASNQDYGVHTVSMITPYCLAILYIGICTFLGQLNKNRALKSIIIFVILCIPLIPYLSITIAHGMDDANRYALYAHNIISERTLWGSDGLMYEGKLNYIDQPGYRYWLALLMCIFNGETRALQIFNLGVLLLCSLGLLLSIKPRLNSIDISKIALFFMLSSPYAAKNILMGLTEWFSIVLFLGYITFLTLNKPLISTILAALLPFIRQNLFITSGVLAMLLFIQFRKRWIILLYPTIAALPLYHNLYFAGKFKLLVENTGTSVDRFNSLNIITPLKYIFAAALRSLEYIGYEPETNILALAIAWIFVPIGTFLVLKEFLSKRKQTRKIAFLLLLATIGPTLVFGYAYYPRFVYVSQTISLISLIVLPKLITNTKQKSHYELA